MKKSNFYLMTVGGISLLMLMAFSPSERPASVVPAYLNTAYTFEERAADLVSRLTIEEKQSLIGNSMAAVPRLGINEYNVWGEALHGVVGMFNPNYESATSFPNSIALGASWDPELMELEATAISDEARGVNHIVISNLTFWSPVVEPVRDPRWGRTGETYGEDPFLISQIAGGFIRGIMGYDSEYLKAVPTAKHYFANNSEFNRHTGTSNMDDRDAREFYLAPYKKLIEKDNLPGIMTCYNRVNGVPITASEFYVDSIARKTYGLDGYVTGDCGAVSDIYAGHHYAGSNAEAAAMALKAGVDTDCGDVFQSSAIEALNAGLIEMADIDRALLHMFTIRMRTGEFDPVEKVPYSGIVPEVVNSQEHVDMAIEVATRTPVLLKNEKVRKKKVKALPLDPERIKEIAVIGPVADRVVLGPYSGMPPDSNMVAPLTGIRDYLEQKGHQVEVTFSSGANTKSRSNLFYFNKIKLKKANGTVVEVDATNYDDSSGGFSIDTRGEEPSLRRINDGNWAAYRQVDIGNIDSISLDLAVVDAGGSVEVRVGSATGNLLANFELPPIPESAGFIMRRARTFTAKVNQLGLSGPQDIYVVFHAPSALAIDEETLALAASADVAVVFVGTDDRTASEESDRLTLLLPGNQVDLIKAVAEVNPYTVVVMQSLGMVEVDQFKDINDVPGILWTGYNGQGQGPAMAKILFGEVNPGGKLNTTWYRTVNDLPDITDYELRGGDQKNGRTYWYFDKDVSYEFGYGLSYTTFEYDHFSISSSSVTPNDRVTVSVDVTNTGDVVGDEIVQVYVRTPESPASLQRPAKRLKGFQRVTFQPAETRRVNIEIDCADLWFWDPDQDRITFDQGRYIFEIGASSRDIRGEVQAVMKGIYRADLKTVVAECDQVVLELGDQVQTRISAVMSDDRFYDISEARVTYSSSDPDVLLVDDHGKVTASGAGVASVIASVTVEGKTVSDSYPIAVMPDLSLAGLTINEEQFEAFGSGIQSYSILVDSESNIVPVIDATPASKDAVARVEPAEKIPGTALIAVTDRVTGKEKVYTVNMDHPSMNDEFNNGSPVTEWSWIRENSDNWSLTEFPGFLTITAQQGDIQGEFNNMENLMLQSANTDWIIESKLEFNRKPQKFGEQGGILAYQDDDNYVKLTYNYAFGGLFTSNNEFIELAVERKGSLHTAARLPAGELFEDGKTVSLVFRLKKVGSHYDAYYSIDGESFEPLGSTELVMSDIQAGVMTGTGETMGAGLFLAFLSRQQDDVEPLKAKFDYFRIKNSASQ